MASLDDDRDLDEESKEVYYLRLHQLMVKHATYVLRCKFDQFIPPDQLHTVLQNKKNVDRIRYAFKNNIIKPHQKAQLQPTSGPPDSKKFDISLLNYLLRNICGLNAKSPWWKKENNCEIPRKNKDVEADIVRIRNLRNKLHHTPTASLEQDEFESEWDLAEEVMIRLTEQCGIPDFKQKIDEVKVSKLDLISEELRSMRANTEIFLEEYQDEQLYVETKAFKSAHQRLKANNTVVLTGHPGEGKTTMAARLALSTTPSRNCLVLTHPSDWRHVDLSLKLIKTIIIDDIFGAGSLDEKMVGHWRIFLPEIYRAAKNKAIQVIITSRDYIFKESKEELGAIPMFAGENDGDQEVLLASTDLVNEEKVEIFKSQAKRNRKDVPIDLITECVMASTDESHDILFGFPECVSMFVRNNKIYDKGSGFFKQPVALFKTYLQNLYKSRPRDLQDKFLALVIVWSKDAKLLSVRDFERVKTASNHVKRVAESFDREVDIDFLDTIKRSLDSHVGGFLKFNDKSGHYAFSHNVIGDMVGLVIAEKKPEQAIEICPRDFLMEYVGIGKHEEYKVTLKEWQYPRLAERMADMILRRDCNGVPKFTNDEFHSLMRSGKRRNTINVHSMLDFGVIKHGAFTSKQFMELFISHVVEKHYVEEMFRTPVMSMTGFFLDYGISMDTLDMRLLDYAWFIGARVFAMEILQKTLVGKENKNPTVALLLAVHSRDIESVRYLLQNDTRVTGDAIYIAIHDRIDILKILLNHPGTDVNDRGNAVNGNYPLIVASRKGLTDSVKCLLQSGANPGVQNSSNMTALHKAIIYKKRGAINALLERGAPLDVRGGKFKRTPLHIAVDMGDQELVELFIQRGAPLLIKDHRGHYPIHIAAIRGNAEIVRKLLPVDRNQETHRISSYGKLSKIKGFSLYHIAVWKKDKELLRVLIEMGANPNGTDWYGQSALYAAIMNKEEAVVSILLENEYVDKKKGQKQGFTPLHAAIYRDLTEVALKLIPHSNVNARDKFGKTPLHGACEKVNTRVIECLLEHRADIRMMTKRGDTIFHILRRQMSKSGEEDAKQKARILERYFVKYDPDFVKQLPKLKNKAGITIKVRVTACDTMCPPLGQFLQEHMPTPNQGNVLQLFIQLQIGNVNDDNGDPSSDYNDIYGDFDLGMNDANDYDDVYIGDDLYDSDDTYGFDDD